MRGARLISALLGALLLVVGCQSRRSLESHTLVRDSVVLVRQDTASVVWRYEIETTYISDTVRAVVERGEVVGESRSDTRVDSVYIVQRDTIAVMQERPAKTHEEIKASKLGAVWRIIGSVAALVGAVVALIFVVKWRR